jgi:NADH-quinone oxidoreductase subunit I
VPEFDDDNIRELFAYSDRIMDRIAENEVTIASVIHGRMLQVGSSSSPRNPQKYSKPNSWIPVMSKASPAPHPLYWGSMPVLKNIAAIAKGMSITFMEMFQPTTVENYPDGKGPLRGARIEARFRGAHVLQRDENGLEKCVACFLCAANCPSNCIYIEAADNTDEHRVSGAERYAKVYNIDYNRCIFCGYCVEACPTDAITHGHGFELATFNASNLVYRKEQMLAAGPAHIGANVVFNQADVDGGAPKEMVAGS